MLLFTARVGREEDGRATVVFVKREEEESILDGSEDNVDGLSESVSAWVSPQVQWNSDEWNISSVSISFSVKDFTHL